MESIFWATTGLHADDYKNSTDELAQASPRLGEDIRSVEYCQQDTHLDKRFYVLDRACSMEFDVVQGDIARQSADVLVNAANTSMKMGTGVSGALHDTGGDRLESEAMEKGPVEVGEVVTTAAYDLDAEYVIHAATMSPHGTASAQTITDATRHTLQQAERLECNSVVFPALGTGSGGFSTAEGARIIARVLAAHTSNQLTDVRIVAHGPEAYETIHRISTEIQQL